MSKRLRSIISVCLIAVLSMAIESDNVISNFFLSADNETAKHQAPIHLVLSVIWQGEHLQDQNLEALKRFSDANPNVPLMHFISAAYFDKAGQNSQDVRNKIVSVIREQDERALSLQAWKSVVQHAGVTFRNSPTFWGQDLTARDCVKDCGYEVPLSSYEPNEINQIVEDSIRTLTREGVFMSPPRSLFVSGWMASRQVLSAAAKHGISFDFSAIAPDVVAPMLKPFPIYDWLTQMWHDSHVDSIPYLVSADAKQVLEFGNLGATADYLDGHEMLALFKKVLKADRDRPTVIHIGVHQETAEEYLPRLEFALPRMFELAEEQEVELKPIAYPQDLRQVSLNNAATNTH